jgi:hypothetical protein
MAIDVRELTDKELENLINNHRRKNVTDQPLYLEAFKERGKRKGGGLIFDTSCEVIRKAASKRQFLSYEDLADASGVKWTTRVHHAIGRHLWELVEFSHIHGWPMLSAIVVNKPNVETGEMEPETLKGFVGAARILGYVVDDEHAFLKEEQVKLFEWAASA